MRIADDLRYPESVTWEGVASREGGEGDTPRGASQCPETEKTGKTRAAKRRREGHRNVEKPYRRL